MSEDDLKAVLEGYEAHIREFWGLKHPELHRKCEEIRLELWCRSLSRMTDDELDAEQAELDAWGCPHGRALSRLMVKKGHIKAERKRRAS